MSLWTEKEIEEKCNRIHEIASNIFDKPELHEEFDKLCSEILEYRKWERRVLNMQKGDEN